MVIGIGLDIVDINELQRDVDNEPEEWRNRVFTTTEQSYCSAQADPYRSLAGTMAAKEAVMKAFGTGWTDEIDWQHVEVSHEPSGRPSVMLHAPLLKLAKDLGAKRWVVSITHMKDMAAAVFILES